MTGPLRIEYTGVFCNVMLRGQRRDGIYHDDRNGEHFQSCLERINQQDTTRFHAVCLITNHHHLIQEKAEVNLNHAMHAIEIPHWGDSTISSRPEKGEANFKVFPLTEANNLSLRLKEVNRNKVFSRNCILSMSLIL